ncbi:MAG TPA: ABC transporter ATP-binding protein [Terriglobales bacterium]|nr:ABC transporter ATP-binding protein [Terriglobales bacterium]
MPVLEYQAVTKEYRTSFGRRRMRALDGFSLTVERGEIFGFLGPNGAGKTTAIHLAMGFMRPSSGSGRMLDQKFGHAATRKRVGFLAENVALYHRPVYPLLRFYGALNGMRDPELARRSREMLETLELSDVSQRNASKLSRGMLQRVGLAQALIHDPELLILDEPTSALDPLGRVAVRELLNRMRELGKTIFLSSHLLSEIELVCDRIAILNRGKLARLGKTSELLESSEESEIHARGLSASDFKTVVADNGLQKLTVPRSEQRATIERIWAVGGEVVRVNPARRSLEDIFIQLTKEDRP